MSSIALLDVIRQVMGDMTEPFVATVHMAVYYDQNRCLVNGREFKESMVATVPRVIVGGDPNELYTLVLIDPDAPHANESRVQEFVSWIVTNIPGGATADQGTEYLSYDPPCPDSGIHRNIFVLYKQPSRLDGIQALASRNGFSARSFARKHNLGKPVRLAYFYVRKEGKKRKAPA